MAGNPGNAHRKIIGRGSTLPLANRFERIHLETDLEQVDDTERFDAPAKIATEYYFDRSESIVSQNQSPDVDFTYSLNPYRGCEHGCSYCYARPTHEFLGFNAGIDFESMILVKPDAAKLFRKWLKRPKWRAAVEPIMLSGVTDCYQRCEKQFELTRQCLQVAVEFGQPIRITTKNGLVRRDIDVLGELASRQLTSVNVSVSSLNQPLVRVMEPRSSSPRARLDTIEKLLGAGIPVQVLVAPIIPGLTDVEIPSILEAVANAGATAASFVVLRLPMSVEPVFLDWLERTFPDRKQKIVSRVQSLYGGKLYDSEFGSRMRGKGIWAEQIGKLFETCQRRYGLRKILPALNVEAFSPPDSQGRTQRILFQ